MQRKQEFCVRKKPKMRNAKKKADPKFRHGDFEKEDAAEALLANDHNFVALLRSCAKQKDLFTGTKIHAFLNQRGLIKKDIIVGSTLLCMYAKCGSLAMAQAVFDELPRHDVVSWTSLIDAYAQLRHGKEALHCFEQMQAEGLCPNIITFLCTIKACSSIGAVKTGYRIHARIVSQGLIGEKQELGNALVDMYARWGMLVKAQKIFDQLPIRNVVSYNTLLAGYTQHGLTQKALISFKRMQDDGLAPNAVTFLCILKACCSPGTEEKGKEIHAEAARQGILGSNMGIGNTLVDMYIKCGALTRAQEVFDEMSNRSIISWNVLISGYAEHGLGEEALKRFEQMQDDGFYPDAVSFLCILKACGTIGAAEKVEAIHAEIARQQLLESNSVLGNALVDVYAKCGALEKAQHAFNELRVRDVVSWTALMVGFVLAGKHEVVFCLFSRMIGEDITPNHVTFLVVLNACSHLGVVGPGQLYFETMSVNYGIVPTLQHHTCMVDLFSRAGHFDKAMRVIKKMPSSDHLPTWYTLLGACKKCGNVNMGSLAFKHAVQLDKKVALAYVYMSEMYAALGIHEGADTIEAVRVDNEA